MTEGLSYSTYSCSCDSTWKKAFHALEGVPADPDIHHNIIKPDAW